MSRRRPLLPALALALAGIAGIVGMLLLEGAWDALCFALAVVPLVAGGAAAARARRSRAGGLPPAEAGAG